MGVASGSASAGGVTALVDIHIKLFFSLLLLLLLPFFGSSRPDERSPTTRPPPGPHIRPASELQTTRLRERQVEQREPRTNTRSSAPSVCVSQQQKEPRQLASGPVNTKKDTVKQHPPVSFCLFFRPPPVSAFLQASSLSFSSPFALAALSIPADLRLRISGASSGPSSES
ncbi:hypothetical protein SRHO_G00263030 [Serrasalmus rhombeus]